MDVIKATVDRIYELCAERNIPPTALSYLCGVPQATIKSILNKETKRPKVLTIKKICDGLGITLTQFFDNDTFNSVEEHLP